MALRQASIQSEIVSSPEAGRFRKSWSWTPIVRATGIAILLVGILTPIIYLFATSLKSRDRILDGRFLPREAYWRNWPDAFNTIELTLFIRSSFVVGLLSVIITLFIAIPATYVMVRHGVGGKVLYSLVLGSFIAPPVVALLPLFYLLKQISGIDTHWGLALVHGLASVPIAIWLLDGFVRTIPREIDEAAQLDGAGLVETLVRVLMPLMSPGIVATGIICLILSYNELLFALVMTYRPETQTLPVGISLFQGDRLVNYGQMSAASLAGILPVYALALMFQRYLIGGRLRGAIK